MKKYEYCEVVCNYLNNLKGEIEKYEIINLLWSVFGVCSEDVKEYVITGSDVMKLSGAVACDDSEAFYRKLCEIYEKNSKELIKESE